MAKKEHSGMTSVAQSTIEFTFVMVIIFLLAYGLIRIFRWAGLDLAERRWAHEQIITDKSLSTEQQLAPEFYRPKRINSSYRGKAE